MKSAKGKTGKQKKGVSDFLTSLKLTIALLLFLAAVSIIGTVIPQNLSPVEYLRHYSSVTYAVLKTLGMFDFYHSWWFILLFFLLCINLLACSIKHAPRTLKSLTRFSPRLTDDQIKNFTLTARIEKEISLNDAEEKILKILKKYSGRSRKLSENGTVHFYGEKGRFARLGYLITHLSVIAILTGGMIGSIWGVKGYVEIFEGASIRQIPVADDLILDLGFMVRCDDFSVSYYANGAPKEYKSSLSILEDEKEIKKTIEVNHPLKYKGFTFYQSSFGEVADQGGEVTLRVIKRGSKEQEEIFKVKPGDSFTLPKNGLTVKVNRFFSEFFLDDQGEPFNRSSSLNNPALELLIFKGNELQEKTWVFQKFPDFHGSKGDYQFLMQDIKRKYYTGLQVTEDPGVYVVWAGCILMIFGILSAFFFSHQQVWIRTRSVGKKLEMTMAGTAHRNRIGFEKVFERLKSEIEKV